MPRKAAEGANVTATNGNSNPQAYDDSLDFGVLQQAQDYTVESTVPLEIREWIEAEHRAYLNDPNKWREVTLPTQTAADRVIAHARVYCSKERTPALTFQVKTGYPHEGVLAYRVRDKMRQDSKPAEAPAPSTNDASVE